MKQAVATLFLLLVSTSALALEDASPGKNLEGIRLGSTRVAACRVILKRNKNGAAWKHSPVHRFQNGLAEDDLELRDGGTFLEGFEILSRNGLVVQVSRISSDDLPQADYTLGQIQKKHRLQEQSFSFFWPNDGGIERYYFDDLKRGVCFVGQSQDVFFLTEKPNILIVHKPNIPVIHITQGAVGSLDRGEGGRVYANYEDYSRQSHREKNDY